MKSFSSLSATSEAEAVKLLSEKSVPLAGGSNLLNLMKEYVLQPDTLVNIRSISDTQKIEKDGQGGARIGANVTLTEILESALLREQYPALVHALWDAATPQVRNRSTLGG